jgi:hypothetical protein
MKTPAAAFLVLGALAALLPAGAQDAEKDRRLKDLLTSGKLRGKVTAVAEEIGLVVVSIGKDDGVREGDELSIGREGEFVGKAVVDRADRRWSAAKLGAKSSSPRVGDDVGSGGLFTEEQKKRFLEHALSFRPVTEDDRKAVRARVAELEDDDVAVREAASRELSRMGGPARAVLASLDLAALGAEVAARVRDVMREMDQVNRPLRSPGLERDVEYLALADDPRAHDRLKRILAKVRPFSAAGVPEKGPGLDEYLKGWWAYSKDKVRWDPEADRFEEK